MFNKRIIMSQSCSKNLSLNMSHSGDPLNIQYYKHALIINQKPDDGFIGISTFWTPKDKVEELISEENKKKVLVIGQLYTHAGLQYIIRNTLLNPRFQMLIITGFDNNKILPKLKSQERGVLDFPEYENIFWNYFGDTNYTISSPIVIPDDVKTKTNIELIGNMLFLPNYKDIDLILSVLTYRKPWLKSPITVPPPLKSTLDTFDSEKTGFVVRDSNLYRLWQRGLLTIKKFGTMIDGTREVMNLMSILTSEPKMHKDFPAFEQRVQYLPQVCDSKPTEGLVYTYGSRVHDRQQIDNIIKSLSEGIFNRNGVTTTWEPPEDYFHPPPCLVLCTFRIHPLTKKITTNPEFKEYLKEYQSQHPYEKLIFADDLHGKYIDNPNIMKEHVEFERVDIKTSETSTTNMSNITNDKQEQVSTSATHIMYITTVFRSHDYYKGMPSNLFALWMLGEKVRLAVAHNTGLNIIHGPLTNLSIAAHVYEQDFKKLEQVKMVTCGLDARGYFTITLLRDEHKIRVALMNAGNKEVEVWKDDDPHKLCDYCQIYISDISHALYMGRELMRAKHCLDTGEEFIQD